jgi:hypothetical protein
VRVRLWPVKVRPEQPDHGVESLDGSGCHLELTGTPAVGCHHGYTPPDGTLLQEHGQGEL